jgi:threonine/homoserine/homoserine lactone efflux protein
MRMTWTTFVAFLIAVALGAMVPGSTTALVIRQSAVHGARAAVPLVMGVEVGLYAWIIASALGVAAVVGASETAYAEFRRRLERATGTVLIGLGMRMALTKL